MYIENYSFIQDIKLILMTLRIVLKKESTEGFDKLEEVYDDNPKTGITGIGVLSAMMALSATAAGVVISKKKEF